MSMGKTQNKNWIPYNSSSSGLPDNDIKAMAIDECGNKWIGNEWEGILVLNENGAVSLKENQQIDRNILIYPNRASSHLNMESSNNKEITRYDVISSRGKLEEKRKINNSYQTIDIREPPPRALYTEIPYRKGLGYEKIFKAMRKTRRIVGKKS